MKFLRAFILLCLALLSTSGAQAAPLGLTAAQRQSIYDLTGGAVDLRHIVALRPQAAPVSPLAVLSSNGKVIGDVRSFPDAFATAKGFGNVPDPALAGQWWLQNLGIEQAWILATGKGVTIADCDSGFHLEEGDLAPNLIAAKRRDFSDKENPARVDDGRIIFHGTAVAAIMVGARDGVGTNGIAYEAKLIPLQNFNYDPEIDDLDKEDATARCILAAIAIPEVSMIVVQNQTTTGSSETFAGTREAMRLAVQSGVPVVAAAGNSSVELTAEAADDTGSIIVGAVRQSGRIANFSNFGRRVTVAAYGENLHTLYGPGGRMDTFGGTTGATAQVGGAVALMLSLNDGLSPQQVREILEKTRRTNPGNEKVGGTLDIAAAVSLARDTEPDRDWRARAAGIRRGVVSALRLPNGKRTREN